MEEYCQCSRNPESRAERQRRREVDSFVKDLENRYPVTLWLGYSGEEFLLLSGIRVAPDLRSQGVGTQIMQEIIAWAAERGLTIALSPEPIDNRGSKRDKNRLIRFYKRLGFKLNKGRSRDFRIRETMILVPQKD